MLDNIYDEVCNVIIGKMNNIIPFKDVAIASEYKKFKYHKPYWTEQLAHQWKSMVKSRKAYEKCAGS